MSTESQAFNVYVDGIWDLFHTGHVNFLQQVKDKADEMADGRPVQLIVGVCGDGVTEYKRETIMSLDERCHAVGKNILVQVVIKNCPLSLTSELMEGYKIDLVVHGDDFGEEKIMLYYGVAQRVNKFRTVPYTQGVSTTQLLREAVEQGRFSISMETTGLSSEELVARIRSRNREELKV